MLKSGGGSVRQNRSVFSEAFRAALAPKRQAIRILSQVECRKLNEGPKRKPAADCVHQYMDSIKAEIKEICNMGLQAIETCNQNDSTEARVFVEKEKADFYRYLAEIDEDESSMKKSEEHYQNAVQTAASLPSSDPLALATKLNYAIFQREVKKDPRGAASYLQMEIPDQDCVIGAMMKKNTTMWRDN